MAIFHAIIEDTKIEALDAIVKGYEYLGYEYSGPRNRKIKAPKFVQIHSAVLVKGKSNSTNIEVRDLILKPVVTWKENNRHLFINTMKSNVFNDVHVYVDAAGNTYYVAVKK